jgi:predicted RNA binding protein YcfA (HicA-like mRNA interferase family)
MSKLRRLSGKEIITTLEKFGFQQVRQRGSHVVLKRQTSSGEVGCVVPLHREVAIGTIHGILRQARLSVEEFLTKL